MELILRRLFHYKSTSHQRPCLNPATSGLGRYGSGLNAKETRLAHNLPATEPRPSPPLPVQKVLRSVSIAEGSHQISRRPFDLLVSSPLTFTVGVKYTWKATQNPRGVSYGLWFRISGQVRSWSSPLYLSSRCFSWCVSSIPAELEHQTRGCCRGQKVSSSGGGPRRNDV